VLDFLLVLGQVPGTEFQITFNELVAGFCTGYLLSAYLKYAIEIERWYRWTAYRFGVLYRRQKRHAISVIRYRRYRLEMFERRLIRQIKSYLRRSRHDIYMTLAYRPYSALKRRYYIKQVQLERLERRVRRSRTAQTVDNLRILLVNLYNGLRVKV
jgi:hypothetical protein